MSKVWDITPAHSLWEKYYAKMEYKRIGWYALWNYAKQVEVKYD